MTRKMLAAMATAVVASIAFAIPAVAGAQEQGSEGAASVTGVPNQVPAQLSVRVEALQRGKRPALRRTTAVGTLSPFVPGQWVRVEFVRGGRVVAGRLVPVYGTPGAEHGTFRLRSPRLIEPGSYRVRARRPATAEQAGARAATRRFRLRFPSLTPGDRGSAVRLLNRLLRKRGYRAPKGRRFTAATAGAVLALRKVNRMVPTRQASPGILSQLLRGRGAFKLRRPGAGRHVEVDLKRQVMVLANRGKSRYTFHVSTGRWSTPTDRGHFRFYRRHPGYNSLGMLDSVYYNRGEAIHGYAAVPTYPASHGCIRSPIPDARFIYNWVRLGMSIYVY
jgi:lipoprotein-anchoring transpeptidase ErfK/SrfK